MQALFGTPRRLVGVQRGGDLAVEPLPVAKGLDAEELEHAEQDVDLVLPIRNVSQQSNDCTFGARYNGN